VEPVGFVLSLRQYDRVALQVVEQSGRSIGYDRYEFGTDKAGVVKSNQVSRFDQVRAEDQKALRRVDEDEGPKICTDESGGFGCSPSATLGLIEWFE
jgi:hypothetical protein